MCNNRKCSLNNNIEEVGWMINNGLSTEQAKELLEKNGRNVLKEEKPKSMFAIFKDNILNFTNLILGVAIVISIVLKD